MLFLDDYADLLVPSDFISKDVKENFNAGSSTILQVHLYLSVKKFSFAYLTYRWIFDMT